MIERRTESLLRSRLASNPAVALVGPRQCGKTTLARRLGGRYFDLEQEAERVRLDVSWPEVSSGKEFVVLDEAQTWPEVFARLRGAIDEDRKRCGRFLLLGSVSPALMTQVSESLAGRLSLVELTPLLVSELDSDASRRRRWLVGGYPDGGVLKPRAYPQWQRDYLALLAQRDLPAWGLPSKPQMTDRLIRMVAALNGQTWNASQVGKSLGVSYHTVNNHLDYLEGSYLVRRLPSFQTNIRKRLVKSPKVYWRDSGLLHALLHAKDEHALLAQPWVGSSFEGYILQQVCGELSARGAGFEPYFFRTSDGHEVDFVLQLGRERWAIEVKLTSSPSPADVRRLDRTADLFGATRRFLVCRSARPTVTERTSVVDLSTLLEILRVEVS